MVTLPNNENTYNAALKPVPVTGQAQPVQQQNQYYADNGVDYESFKISQLSSPKVTIPKVSLTLGKRVLSLDLETTGLNPWDYKMIVCSVWDLSEPKSEIKTFAGWDEEELCVEMFDYIKSKDPEVILAFNAKFECRGFITRAMYYHIKAPWIFTSEWHDMLAMLEGGWKNGLTGTMPAGSEENWLKFFFNEVKPYNIEECFQGVREGRLDEMIIRNRTCVQGQGDMYKLFMYIQSTSEEDIAEDKPTAPRMDESYDEGLLLVACEVCNAVNEVKQAKSPGQCWRCLSNLPEVTSKNRIREQTRSFDWQTVGMSGDKLKAEKERIYQEKEVFRALPTGNDSTGRTAMERLAKLGITPHKAE